MKKMMILVVLGGLISLQLVLFQQKIVPLSPGSLLQNKLRKGLVKIGLPDPGKEIVQAVMTIGKNKGYSPEFLLVLAYSESSFKLNAISRAGYHGLYQIPQRIKDPLKNAKVGMDIFDEKMKLAKGDYRQALILYKGFRDNPKRGGMIADRVLAQTKRLKEVL